VTKILLQYGTRPEVIKLAPVIMELRARSVDCVVVNSEQHTDLSRKVEQDFGFEADHYLGIMTESQSSTGVLSKALSRLDALFPHQEFDWVIVQGDTTTALAGALWGFHRRVKVAHVEAGLRTSSIESPFPEEMNRRVISLVTSLHFAPTDGAADNLKQSGVNPDSIIVTGNTIVDALETMRRRVGSNDITLADESSTENRIAVITVHRRENQGRVLVEICEGIRNAIHDSSGWTFVWPVHPNPNVSVVIRKYMAGVDAVVLSGPLEYSEMISLLCRSSLIVTDSGGLQEEAAALGRRVLILRDSTERPEIIKCGLGVLVGTSRNAIAREFAAELRVASRTSWAGRNPFGDGRAAARIVSALCGKRIAADAVS